MKAVEITDRELITHLNALPADTMYTFLVQEINGDGKPSGDAVRGAILQSTRLTNEMRAAHELGILESLILGQSYIGALLMTRSLKGQGRLTLDIGCAGPVKGLSVEANAAGEVRGYLKVSPIPVDTPLESFNTSSFFGPGILTVKRYPDGSNQAFTGNIDLQHGTIARDIANYYLVSEQTRTSVSVSVKFDSAGRITGAGGLFIEALPGASNALIRMLEERINEMGSLGEHFSHQLDGKQLADEYFGSIAGHTVSYMESIPVRFACACSRERFMSFIGSVKLEELEDMTKNGPFPVVTICHNCNSRYEFSRGEMEELLRRRPAKL